MTMLGFERAVDENLKLVKVFGQSKFFVINKENENGYEVTVVDNKAVSCTCPHHVYRQVACKHMFTVQLNEVNAG
jgi:hypothetical protein